MEVKIIPNKVSYLDLPNSETELNTPAIIPGWGRDVHWPWISNVSETLKYIKVKIVHWSHCEWLVPKPLFPGSVCAAPERKGDLTSKVSILR